MEKYILEAVTFNELIDHGITSGAQVINGLPTKFTYNGKFIVKTEKESETTGMYKVSIDIPAFYSATGKMNTVPGYSMDNDLESL